MYSQYLNLRKFHLTIAVAREAVARASSNRAAMTIAVATQVPKLYLTDYPLIILREDPLKSVRVDRVI